MSFKATTSQTVGPYFSIGLTRLRKADLAGLGVSGENITISGRVIDGEGKNSGAFEDEEALLNFIRSRLLNESIALPWRRADLDSDLAVPRLLEMK